MKRWRRDKDEDLKKRFFFFMYISVETKMEDADKFFTRFEEIGN